MKNVKIVHLSPRKHFIFPKNKKCFQRQIAREKVWKNRKIQKSNTSQKWSCYPVGHFLKRGINGVSFFSLLSVCEEQIHFELFILQEKQRLGWIFFHLLHEKQRVGCQISYLRPKSIHFFNIKFMRR